jgi:hypothetical protein
MKIISDSALGHQGHSGPRCRLIGRSRLRGLACFLPSLAQYATVRYCTSLYSTVPTCSTEVLAVQHHSALLVFSIDSGRPRPEAFRHVHVHTPYTCIYVHTVPDPDHADS